MVRSRLPASFRPEFHKFLAHAKGETKNFPPPPHPIQALFPVSAILPYISISGHAFLTMALNQGLISREETENTFESK